MSYPRNNASPPTVAVGSIYLIADGTIQTSGASVRVKTAGGDWGAGAGSLAYDATSGAIEYAPSQAESDGEWFMVAVYKASCTTATVTVVTSESATAGRVSLGEILGVAQSAIDLKDFADTGYNPSSHHAAVDLQSILLTQLTETSFGYIAAAFKKLFDVQIPLLVASDVMRGTDSAATAAKLLAYIQLLARSDAAITTDLAVELGEINANEGSGAGDYAATTDSQEALMARTISSAAATALELMYSAAVTSGTVVDVGATSTDFDTDLTEATNDHYNDSAIVFVDGVLKGQVRPISDYVGASKNIIVDPVFTEAPGNGDAFLILGRAT